MNLPHPVYQIKVSLKGSNPLIWRRVLIPAETSLARLHIILQAVMGWENYHLHVFKIHGQEYGDPEDDEFGIRLILDEYTYNLPQAGLLPGISFEYIYDFGDGWVHELEVEATLLEEYWDTLPRCTGGERSGPPEDAGGIDGYYAYLQALKNRRHPRHKEWLAWRGPFDPEKFDLDTINARLFWLSNDKGARQVGLSAVDTLDLVLAYYPSLTRWARGLDSELFWTAEGLPLRRDMAVLLTYLRDHKVTGAQSTGNLPLWPAKEISAQFVNPPAWEFKIGSFENHVRSSADIWPIYFSVVLAEVGELVVGGPARRFRFTQAGSVYLSTPAPLQVWYLLAVWWTRVNWLVAFPYDGVGEQLPFGFNQTVGEYLMELPDEEDIPVETFADHLVSTGKLAWESRNQERARENLREMIERSVVRPLVDFGILAPHYQTSASVVRETKN